jgi:hypothetical protein
MNIALIILLIIILVLVLYLLFYVQGGKSSLTNMNKDTMVITNKDIVNPMSVRSSYSMWLYVNSWSSVKKIICSAGVTGSANVFELYLDANTPTLKCDIRTASGAIESVSVTNNFPVQRWVYIVISIDGKIVDCYLDGKLIKSQQLQNLSDMPKDYNITSGAFDAYLTTFYRKPAASDPQTVWSNYMSGNGYTSNNLMSDYGFSFSVTKDNREIVGYKY